MTTLHFTTTINATRGKVWHTMLDDETYREWTSAFAEGSSYTGSWEQGSKIVFGDSEGNGMVARIAENRPHEFISIEHMGMVQNGIEDTESEDAKKLAGAQENYTFSESNGVTELKVDIDTDEEYEAMFEEMWPRALKKLKALCEK